MGYLFDERKFINNSAEWLQSHLGTQYARFLDSSPSYVTYYSINNDETTVDLGFRNIEKMLGDNSPVRFNKVNGLPVYGIDQIVPSTEEAEEGINYSYDGSMVVLPNTIKPVPNDYFTVDYLGETFIFMVTNVATGNIMDNGYFQVDFTLKHTNEEKMSDLRRQTSDSYDCIVQNMGTDEKVIIKSSDIIILEKLNKITEEISNYYKILFYDKKYNSLLFNRGDGTRLYDRLLTHFINKNKVFFKRGSYDTLLLTNEDPIRTLLHEYHNSIYRAIEERKPELIKPMFYGEGYVTDIGSVFFHWGDRSIRTTFFGMGNEPYINNEVVEIFSGAEEYFKEVEVEVEVASDKKAISIPVDGGKVFTQDAGYPPFDISAEDAKKEKINSSVSKPITNEVKSSGKISLADIEDLFGSESVEPEVNVVVINKDKVFNSTKKEYEDDFEGEVYVQNIVEKVIQCITKEPEEIDVIAMVITKYLSGNATKLDDLDVDTLIDYADFMKPNHYTFVLVPILLYVLESYYKSSISNN